ncbi:hypothetical protein [Streptomyces sp. NPDC003077]|uniref:hypothetical protein n=1 Tax=Streptomyces sp. NPDC003077 TaxID=3154443 RepID=UPI0033B355AC
MTRSTFAERPALLAGATGGPRLSDPPSYEVPGFSPLRARRGRHRLRRAVRRRRHAMAAGLVVTAAALAAGAPRGAERAASTIACPLPNSAPLADTDPATSGPAAPEVS